MNDLSAVEQVCVNVFGVGFGSCGEGFLRLSAFGDPDDTKEAAKRIVEHFAK